MHRTLLVIVAALGAAACDAASTSAPQRAPLVPEAARASAGEATAPEAAWGGGTVTFGRTIEDILFYARRTDVVGNPFAARGDAYFNDRTARVHGHIKVNCLSVTGNIATISGIVTESNDPTIRGWEALFQVQDNDPPAGRPADFSSIVNLHEVGIGPDCAVPSEFDLVPLRGYVEVQPEVAS
jgi:hypothetical protein